MNIRMIAMILIAFGIVVLAYSGITYKTSGKPANVLGVQVQTTHTHYIPPVAGALALAGGIALLLGRSKAV